MKKLFSILMLVFVAFTATFVGVSLSSLNPQNDNSNQSEITAPVDANWSGSGTSASPYTIASVSDLQTLATNVNAGTTYSGIYFKLTTNLDLSSVSSWTPIGNSSSGSFRGVFDGNKKIISNMTISASSSYAGLFGYTYGATIKNLVLENVSVTSSSSYVGGLAGRVSYNSTVSGCIVTGSVSGYGCVGGVVGYVYSIANISDCFSSATVTGTYTEVGGIVGSVNLNGAYIERCANYGSISAESYAGGIVGMTSNPTEISDCYNTGTIKVTSVNAGGIVGYAGGSSSRVDFCYNTGSITASESGSGIAGYCAGASIMDCWAYCSISLTTVPSTISGDGILGGTSSVGSSSNYWYDTKGTYTSSHELIGTYTSNLSTLAMSSSFYTSGDYVYWYDFSTANCSQIWYLFSGGGFFPVLSSALWWDVAQTGSSSSQFQIADVTDMRVLAIRTNMGSSVKGVYFKQTANISLSTVSNWTPIGRNAKTFRANFDGNGKSISGLYSDADSSSYQGLFGCVSSGTLKNIILISPTVMHASYNYVGSLVGYLAASGSVSYCTAYSPTVDGNQDTGGLIGYASGGTVTRCNAIGVSVTGNSYLGGLIGYASGVVNINYCTVSGTIMGGGSYTGGIVGYAYNSSSTTRQIQYCYNTADIESSGSYVGGITGFSRSYNIYYCVNDGNVEHTATSNGYVGGICGYFYGYNTSSFATMRYCYNTGAVSGYTYVGGLIGRMYYYAYLYDSYNAGAVTGTNTYIGGLVGYIYSYSSSSYMNNIYWCYNKGTITSNCTSTTTGYVGGLVGYIGYGCVNLWANFNVGGVQNTGTNTCYRGAITGGYTTSYSQSISGNFFDSGLYSDGLTASDGDDIYARDMDSIDCDLYDDYYYWNISDSTNAGVSATWILDGGYPVLKNLYSNFGGGYGTSTNPYQIYSVSDLKALQWNVNIGNNYSGVYFKQCANLDLSSIINWMPIGNYSVNSVSFQGNYDGDGFSISGVKINAGAKYQGLFGRVYYGSIENLSLSFSTVENTASYSGIMVGYLYYSTISYCNVKSSSISAGQYSGGLVGVGNYSKIENCYNSSSTVKSTNGYVGGIIGSLQGSTNSHYIMACYNSGAVSGSSYIGGIAGYTYYYINVRECYNTGSISGSSHLGGIVGHMYNYTSTASSYRGNIGYCYNKGSVSGTNFIGGIVGYVNNYGQLFDNYNIGSLSGANKGGIGGYCYSISSSYQFENVWYTSCGASYAWGSNSSNVGASTVTTNSSSDMWTFAQSYWYNCDMIWMRNSAVNGGYPTLKIFYFAEGSGNGTSSDPFLVNSATNLQIISKTCNFYEHGYENIYFFQTSTISLSGTWTPIASWRSNYVAFRGNYNGDQQDIDGIFLHPYTGMYQGLFGYTEGAQLTSVWLCNVDASSDLGGFVGGLVGYASSTTISDCSVDGIDVYACSYYVGGIVGCLEYSEIIGAYVSGSIGSEGDDVGGAVGFAEGSTISDISFYGRIHSYGLRTGGIVGEAIEDTTISNVKVYADDGISSDADYVGGIAGVLSYSTITQALNENPVTGTGSQVGGIVGRMEGSTIYEAKNEGAVSAASDVGGIVGEAISGNSIYECYNEGTVSATGNNVGGIAGWIGSQGEIGTDTISMTYNKGAVSGAVGVGGIAGIVYSDVEILYSYNVAGLTGTSSVGGVVGSVDYYEYCYFEENYWETEQGMYGIGSEQTNDGAFEEQLFLSDTAMGENWDLYHDYWDFYDVWRIFPEGTVTISNGTTFESDGFPMFLWELPYMTQTVYPNGGTGASPYVHDNYTRYVTLKNTYTRAGFLANGWNKTSVITATPNISDTTEFRLGEYALYANWTPLQLNLSVQGSIYDLSGNLLSNLGDLPEGASLTISGYTTTLTGYNNNTTYETLEVTSASTIQKFRQGQTLKLAFDLGDDWVVDGWSSMQGNNNVSIRGNGKFSVDVAIADYGAVVEQELVLLFYQLGPVLKYDPVDKFFYFEDGMFPQTAVVTYDEGFNTALSGLCDYTDYFELNGITFYTYIYNYSSADNDSFAIYDGQRFLGFEMPTTRTIKFKTDKLTSRTFEAGTTYWFKYEPIRWRVTNYGVEQTALPTNWNAWLETQTEINITSDVLWWDQVNDESSNPLGAGDGAIQTDLYKKIISSDFIATKGEYSEIIWAGYDVWSEEGTNNKVMSTGPTSSSLIFASTSDISYYQSDLRCYASQLVAVLANKNQTEYFEYWTRDFGQQMGCGTYVTKSGTVLKNSYWNTQKGVRFSTRLTQTTYAGDYLGDNLFSVNSVQYDYIHAVDYSTGYMNSDFLDNDSDTQTSVYFQIGLPIDVIENNEYLVLFDVDEFYSSTGTITVDLNAEGGEQLSAGSFEISSTGVYSYIAKGIDGDFFFSGSFAIDPLQLVNITFKVSVYEL